MFQFLRFIEQLSGVLGVDCVSADVGLDGASDAIFVRAEQLAKNEAAAVTDQKSQIYALKRKLKTMKEQLDGKVWILEVFLKYSVALCILTFVLLLICYVTNSLNCFAFQKLRKHYD